MSEQPPAPVPVAAPPAPAPQVQPEERVPGGRARLAVAAGLFLAWLSWLGATALNKPPAPVVSRALAAGAAVPVVAELTAGQDGRAVFVLQPANGRGELVTEVKERADRAAVRATVVEALRPGGPDAGAVIGVTNLPAAVGFAGPGKYLLLLNKDPGLVEADPAYSLALPPRSPGHDAGGPPTVYPWSEAHAPDLRKQVQKLFP